MEEVTIIPRQVIYNLENIYIKEVLSLLKWFKDSQQISQPGDPAKGLKTPRGFDFEVQWDLIRELAQDWGNRLLEGTNKTLCTPGPRRKEQ